MSTPAKIEPTPPPSTIEDVLVRGDLSKLTPQQRIQYTMDVCNSLGLNWRTRPFEFITLGGKLVFYARKDATDQLRKLHGISVEILSQELANDLLTVRTRATDKTGRTDEDIGVVSFKNVYGEIAANLRMKAVTKAKRRVTLSISGLGFLDETEVEPSDDDLIAEHDAPVDHDAPIVEPRPYKITAQSWRMFSEILKTELARAKNKSDVFEWLKLNKDNINAMKEKFPTMYESLNKEIEAIKAEPT